MCERERVCVYERESVCECVSERERVCVCERESVCVSIHYWMMSSTNHF